MSSKILVRLMVERPGERAAADDAEVLLEMLRSFGSVDAPAIEKYWKIEEWFHVGIVLEAEDAEATLLRVAQHLADTWHWGPGRHWAIWDLRLHGAFKIERLAAHARWAHIEIV